MEKRSCAHSSLQAFSFHFLLFSDTKSSTVGNENDWIWIVLEVNVRFLGRLLDLRSEGPIIGITGPSGAGKSTFLRILAGLERRASGLVRYKKEVWQNENTFVAPWKRRVGWVPQESLLFPHLTVAQNLRYAAKLSPESIASWLEISHLMDRAPRYLSGGERARVALGRALLSQPSLLLLDEPFAALDRRLREKLGGELGEKCRKEGLPVVMVSHDRRDLEVLEAEQWLVEETGLRAERG